jgi:hypothetical protein
VSLFAGQDETSQVAAQVAEEAFGQIGRAPPMRPAALVPPTTAAISLLLLSLTHFNPTAGIRCTKAVPEYFLD